MQIPLQIPSYSYTSANCAGKNGKSASFQLGIRISTVAPLQPNQLRLKANCRTKLNYRCGGGHKKGKTNQSQFTFPIEVMPDPRVFITLVQDMSLSLVLAIEQEEFIRN